MPRMLKFTKAPMNYLLNDRLAEVPYPEVGLVGKTWVY
jgi:hypothetical protein